MTQDERTTRAVGVQKYGGTSVATAERILAIAGRIERNLPRTPGLVVVRYIVSRAATRGLGKLKGVRQLAVHDVSCAFLHADMDEPIYRRLPGIMWLEGCPPPPSLKSKF